MLEPFHEVVEQGPLYVLMGDISTQHLLYQRCTCAEEMVWVTRNTDLR